MASIKFSELCDWIKKHPDYAKRIEMDVPPEQAIYIEFDTNKKRENLDSDTFETTEGIELVLDKDNEGLVCGLEIV